MSKQGKLKRTLALAAILAGATTGAAHATEGWYGRADIGWSFDGEVDMGNSTDNYPWGSSTLEHDVSEHLGLGYALDNNFRLEGELGHRRNPMEDAGTSGVFNTGDINAWSAMANLFYDFNRGGKLEPYVGIGVGAARINVRGTDSINPFFFVDGEDTVFAYQGMVGFAVGLGEQWDLDVGYRYFKADGAEYDSIQFTNQSGELDYEHQALTIGLRYQFAAPAAPPVVVTPPPPPPPPQQPPRAAACPTSEFVVYFEWDRSNLNQAALETIDAAVNRARQCNVSGTVVVGHTDTSGSPTYNQGLSERRASVVRDALTARGLPGTIQTQARGETDLARATRDGVREPLNRRSAVTISFR
ncbi:MAG: outer membrane beta-barrel protein [Terricaulis sp.]